MRNELTISTSSGALQLFSSLDAGENSLIINGSTIPAASWTGSGTYTTTIGGVTYTITKAAADTGNLQLIQTGAAAFAFRDINGLKDGTFKDLSCGIDTTAASGTTDGDLYRAINALGWASDVISSALLNVKKLFTKITQEISQLRTDLTPKRGTFTRAAGQGSGAVDLAVWQSGNVVTLCGYMVDLSIPANTQTLIGTITGVSLPATTVRLRGGAGSNAYSIGNDAIIIINTSGEIYVTTTASSSAVYFNAVWIR